MALKYVMMFARLASEPVLPGSGQSADYVYYVLPDGVTPPGQDSNYIPLRAGLKRYAGPVSGLSQTCAGTFPPTVEPTDPTNPPAGSHALSAANFTGHFAHNRSPVLVSALPFQPIATYQTPFEFDWARTDFTDPDGDTLAWSVEFKPSGTGQVYGARPSWASFDAEGLRFYGTAPNLGDYQFRRTVTDPAGLSMSEEFVLRINPAS